MNTTRRSSRKPHRGSPESRRHARAAAQHPRIPPFPSAGVVAGKVIRIHPSNRSRRFDSLMLSTRALNILQSLNIRTLGDLDGVPHQRILESKNCGNKSYEEIMRVADTFEGPVTASSNGVSPLSPSHRTIAIPEESRGWSVGLLPLSVRLRHAMQRLNCKTLGDLHGLSYGILTEMPDCGSRTQAELREFVARVQRGMFGQPRDRAKESAAAFIVGKFDEFVEGLGTPHRSIFMERVGASADPVTLMSVGRKYKMTRERVRQIISMLMEKAMRHGGPPLDEAIREFVGEINRNLWPLTPALFSRMVSSSPRRPQHSLTFYIRLLGWIERQLSVWPFGQSPAAYRTPEQERVLTRVKEWFRGKSSPTRFSDVWRGINTAGFQCSPYEFLESVKFAAEIALNLEDPQNPIMHPPVDSPRRWARQVLSTPNPATLSADTLSRAKALLLSRRSSSSRYRLACVQSF